MLPVPVRRSRWPQCPGEPVPWVMLGSLRIAPEEACATATPDGANAAPFDTAKLATWSTYAGSWL